MFEFLTQFGFHEISGDSIGYKEIQCYIGGLGDLRVKDYEDAHWPDNLSL